MPSEARLEQLGSEAHIWLCSPATDEQTERCLELLAPSELDQLERFRVERPRRLYLSARSLARSVLSLYRPEIPADAWRFRLNAHGRPEIEVPNGPPDLRFNLSHTDGLVACILGVNRDVGVDVEDTRRSLDLDMPGVARHSFSRTEAADVRTRSGEDRRRRFFSSWTLKEAYIKARGMGLALPLRRFSYRFPVPGEVTVSFDPEVHDREDEWQLGLWRASVDHFLAAAVRRGSGSDLAWVVRRSTPLAEDAELVSPEPLALSTIPAHV